MKKMEDAPESEVDEKVNGRTYGFIDAYYLVICQGCVHNCSYCAIKKAKGKVKSKPIPRILSELKYGLELGYKHFMIIGDDCGSYGMDIGTDLAELLNVLQLYDIRIHINYFEPGEFIKLYPKIQPGAFEIIDFINIPVQATSRRILKLMNRKYNFDDIITTVKKLKTRFSHIYLETHVIFGFPTETMKEFTGTFHLLDSFDAVICFYYTDRGNVASSRLSGKIAGSEMIARTQKIIDHPQFSWSRETAKYPTLLLVHSLERETLFSSITRNCTCFGKSIAIS
ncbi:MAG: radical SAM protein [Pseudomonadota bacterium]